MRNFRVRVWLKESYFSDMVITAENWFTAQATGQGMSPIGKALFLGEA